MVVYYDLDTKEILRTEDNTMSPLLPFNMTFDDKVNFYREQKVGFIGLPYELGAFIDDYKMCFNGDLFVGLQPKAVHRE